MPEILAMPELTTSSRPPGVEATVTASIAHLENALGIPFTYGNTDKRFERLESARYFGALLESGVEIHLYKKTMIHTKLVLCDDQLALFGSINFNRRSMLKDEEIGVVAANPEWVRKLRRIYEKDLENAEVINSSEWHGPNAWEMFLHWVLTPFRNQM